MRRQFWATMTGCCGPWMRQRLRGHRCLGSLSGPPPGMERRRAEREALRSVLGGVVGGRVCGRQVRWCGGFFPGGPWCLRWPHRLERRRRRRGSRRGRGSPPRRRRVCERRCRRPVRPRPTATPAKELGRRCIRRPRAPAAAKAVRRGWARGVAGADAGEEEDGDACQASQRGPW